MTIKHSIALAAKYIDKHTDAKGRFAYKLDPQGQNPASFKYNVVRHAGTIYALGQHFDRTEDSEAGQTLLRAARYLQQYHVREIDGLTNIRGVFSLQYEEVPQAGVVKLGGTALGVVGFVKAHSLDPTVISLDELRQLGNFILFMQEKSGRFRSKYSETQKFALDFNSLYYPGETILALSMLYEVDPDLRWLQAAMKAAAYLVQSRKGSGKLPNDHWLMIAGEKLYPHLAKQKDPPITPDDFLEHMIALGQTMLNEQKWAAVFPGAYGAFGADGSSAPTATRLEGLVALYFTLPGDHSFRPTLKQAIEQGVRFLQRCQYQEGPVVGGFRRMAPGIPGAFVKDAAWVRIDYVQHALSALIGWSRIQAQ